MTDFELCLSCARLCGQTPRGRQGCGHSPGDPWPDVDFSEESDLCVLCARGLAGGPDRWSWLACTSCRSWDEQVRGRIGRSLLPLGRHSIMNTAIGVDQLPADPNQAVAALVDQFEGWERLDSWQSEEVSRLAHSAGVEGWTIPYAEWSELFPESAEASRDAYLRLRRVDPSWVVATFPVLGPDATVDPADAGWVLSDVGQPRLREPVRHDPWPYGHDVTIGVGRTGWYMAFCMELGCYWRFHSMAFPLVRWHGERHYMDASTD